LKKLETKTNPGVFAKKITELREAKGLPKSKIAGVSSSYMQKIENENFVPSGTIISKLAKALSNEGSSQLEALNELASQQNRQNTIPTRPQELSPANLAGVCRASIGKSRVEAFRELTLKAQERVVIMGIGMTNLAKYAQQSLEKLAAKVPIYLLMIDPVVLESEPEFAKKLEDFLGFSEFTASAHQAFDTLGKFCKKWNAQKNQKHKMQFRVYNTIPTMSMVMIDPKREHGEIELEFFLYQSGEFRPRFAVKRVKHNDSLFALLDEKFEQLWKRSRRIV
jgi:transcriptional regulator with XRE-family HTH domain